MREFGYEVRGFLTIRGKSLRVPLNGALAVRADPDSGRIAGDLVLAPSTVTRTVLGVTLVTATVTITAESVAGRIDDESRLVATATVNASIAAAQVAGRTLLSGGSCRTAAPAMVPFRSRPGFALERGGRLVGRYRRPPFTGCGWITPLFNLLVTGPGNAAVIDLIPIPA
ncbi:MAG TPA: hypothetical protein VFU43_22025 [Streptosporangiaceae bacterium]|nr:hypothetical protein [Streptosporangiaceae bacterium]